MKSVLSAIVSGGLVLCFGSVLADSHEAAADEPNVASPVEMFACKYNKGKGPADLDAAVKTFNAWADKNGVDDYFAWTLVPYYSSPEQDFDVIWLGGSKKARTLGKVQDTWIAKGGKAQQGFNDVWTCDTHAAYSSLRMKVPPTRTVPGNVVISFSDCNTAEDSSFDTLYEPLIEWGKYREGHGSTAGMWIFFPSFGGGGDDFEFKFVSAYQNLEELGADWDQMNESGWQKVNELFAGKLSCDASRTYLATNRRAGGSDD